jgi:lysophospholipase L1-like esterase
MRQAGFVSKDGKADAFRRIGVLALWIVAAALISQIPAAGQSETMPAVPAPADHAARAAADPNSAAYPDPRRWSEDIRAFEQWDSRNSFPSEAVVFVGSSSIRLWPTARAFPGYPVINRGFGGSYMADSVYYADRLILKYKPRAVVVFAGTNDIAGGIPAERVHQDFVRLAEIIHAALPDAKIIYLTQTPTESRWHFWDQMRKTDMLNKDFAAGKDFITFVDTADLFLGPNGRPDATLFVEDKLHLSEKGYEIWNALLTPILNQIYSCEN